MSRSRSAAPPPTVETESEYLSWRQAQELHALRDTLALYRRYAAVLAAENARLHELLADVGVGALRNDGKRSLRTRGDRCA